MPGFAVIAAAIRLRVRTVATREGLGRPYTPANPKTMGMCVARREMGLPPALAGEWSPALYQDFRKTLPTVQSPAAGISTHGSIWR